MDQHPVPQNISSYEFRLVGDMTLKQFFQLAGGAGMGFLFFKMPLPFFLKWPLVFLAVLTGIMLAFVPVGGRPFSQWLMAFIRAIYSPTKYAWHYVTPSIPMEPIAPLSVAPQTPFDKIEDQVMTRVSQLFNQPTKPLPVTPPAPAVPVMEPSPTFVPPPPDEPVAPTPPPAPLSTQTTYIKSENIPHKPLIVAEVEEKPEEKETEEKEPMVTYAPPPISPLYDANVAPHSLTPVVEHHPMNPSGPAVITLGIPSPERPNLVTGLVVDTNELPIEAAIVEISQTHTGIPVRALRTNRIGQFQTATPLNKGDYTIVTEKDGYTFDSYSIVVEDKIIKPVLIKALTHAETPATA
jgi:hypothetical protein